MQRHRAIHGTEQRWFNTAAMPTGKPGKDEVFIET